jgi:hypothetical protein
MRTIFDLEKGMTEAISHFSRYDDASVDKHESPYVYRGSKNITAEQKIKRFYWFTIGFLAIAAIVLFLITNISQIEELLPSETEALDREQIQEGAPSVEREEQ